VRVVGGHLDKQKFTLVITVSQNKRTWLAADLCSS